MKKFKNTCLQPVFLAMCLIAICGSANATDNIVEVADKAGTFKTLLKAAKGAGLAHTLQADGPFTVFAPTDDAFASAFAKYPRYTLSKLLQDKEKLATILKYHVISGKVAAKDAVQVESAKTLSGDSVTISIRDGRLTVNDANVIVNGLEASNGIIHVIDRVLIPPTTVGRIIRQREDLSSFSELLEKTQIGADLTDGFDSVNYTVFVPNNKAFESLPEGAFTTPFDPRNDDRLRTAFYDHIAWSAIPPMKLEEFTTLRMVTGQRLPIDYKNNAVGGAAFTGEVIPCFNGMIYVIDKFLANGVVNIVEVADNASVSNKYRRILKKIEVPADLKSYGRFYDYGLWKGTSYAGHSDLPEGYWVYVYPNWYIWGEVTEAARTGSESAETHDPIAPPGNSPDNLVEVADKAGTFKTLLAAAKAAGLVHALQEDGPLTVFAPTDDAFAKLPARTLNDLLKPENKQKLATILKHHVISGKFAAKEAVQVGSAKTLSGDSVSISIRGGRLAVNDANVIVNDVEASNGIIHVIDSVLLPPKPKNIVETAAARGNLKTLVIALNAAGLAETLESDGPFTVLAPSDEAFGKLGEETLASLLETKNKRKLRSVLEYHLIPRRLSFDDIVDLPAIKTVQGADVHVVVDPFADPYELDINQSSIISRDIDAANGIIHVIDSVLLPPEPKKKSVLTVAEDAGGFSTLLAAIDAAGLREVLEGKGPFTVFAPTDKAFAEFAFEEATTFCSGQRFPSGAVKNLLKPENKTKLAAILTYHVVPGKVSSRQAQLLATGHGKRAAEKVVATVSGQKLDLTYLASSNPNRVKSRLLVNDATVLKADIEAGNGVIHVIDSVLHPPEPKNIVDTAAAAGNFKTLIAALTAAGLAEKLKGEGPFTVLAPSDEAFAKLPHGTIESLLKPENKHKLQAILKYHLVPGRISQSEIFSLRDAGTSLGYRTLAGAFVSISIRDGRLTINDANVIVNDLKASNGIIHVIDAVLMPPADDKAGHQNTSHISPASSSSHSGAELLEIQEQNRDLIHIRELDCFFPACWKFRIYIPQNRGTKLRLTSGICQGSKFSVDQLTRTDSVEIPPHIDGGEFDISVTIRLNEEGQYACYIFVADPGKRTFWKSVSMPTVPDLKILTNPWEKFAQSSKRVMRTKTFHKGVKMYKFGEPIPLVVLNKSYRDEFKASDITAQSTPAVWLTFPGPQ